MEYKYITDVSRVEQIIELFREFVIQQDNRHAEEPSLCIEYIRREERYKQKIPQQGRERLLARPWSRDAIESGEVAEMAIRAMDIRDNNLVDPHQKTIFRNKLRSQPGEGGEILYRFYIDDKDDRASLEEFASFFGRRYDIISYLFFLKNPRRYLPCKSRIFENAFGDLGIKIDCFSSCTYDNYLAYNASLQELAYLYATLDEYIDILDAHSFAWIIARYDEVRAYIFDEKHVNGEQPDDKDKQEGLAHAKIRLNQTTFRKNVRQFWGDMCCVTGCSQVDILVASHIKPWRVCKKNSECIDAYNGLLLIPNLDSLFDAGYISFQDDGTIMVSPHLSPEDARILGISESAHISGLQAQHHRYLEYHREHLFRK